MSIRDLDVDDVDAGLRLRVASTGVPFAGLADDIVKPVGRNAAPLSAGRKTRAARPCELKEQRLATPVLRPNCVRAHLAAMTSVCGQDLVLVEDCLTDNGVGVWHGGRPVPVGGAFGRLIMTSATGTIRAVDADGLSQGFALATLIRMRLHRLRAHACVDREKGQPRRLGPSQADR